MSSVDVQVGVSIEENLSDDGNRAPSFVDLLGRRDRQEVSMQWKGISWGIGKKHILYNVTGSMDPGSLTCVLGHSGSGKSSLMNVLAGRQRTNAANMNFEGEILVCGHRIDPVSFRGKVAYVMQDDNLFPTETPRECLKFSSYLRLPTTFTEESRTALVAQLITSLHLTKCADTMVGSQLVKGISGGERKRTSVGVELIAAPTMLFLDEPLSGLDALAAYTLTQTLKDLASMGVPVLCTVHQPSSEIFAMFDAIILLHEGEVVYHGSVTRLPQYLQHVELPCPLNFNPADHVMFVIQREPGESIRGLKDTWSQGSMNQEITTAIDRTRASAQQISDAVSKADGRRASFATELSLLTSREARATLRNREVLVARYGSVAFLSGLHAWLYAGSGSNADEGEGSCVGRQPPQYNPSKCASDFQAHFAAIIALSIITMMGNAQPVLLTFPQERPIFLREYAAGQYSVVFYFASKTAIELPVVLLAQVLTYLISFWIMDLQGNFLLLVFYSWLLGVASSSLSLVVSSAVSSVDSAIQLAPLVLVPQLLFSGLFIPVDNIPPSLKWVSYLCPMKYAVSLLEMEEFDFVRQALEDCSGKHGKQTCHSLEPGVSPVPGAALRESLLKAQKVEWGTWLLDLCVILAITLAFRIVAMVLLWRRGKYVL